LSNSSKSRSPFLFLFSYSKISIFTNPKLSFSPFQYPQF
jgi:hypothetical protein